MLKLSGLLALTVFALGALNVGSASAATKNEKIGEIPNVSSESPNAGMLAVNDHNSHTYAADSGTRHVRDYASPSDATPTEWTGSNVPAGEFLGILSIAIDNSTGDVYVADTGAALIYKFDQDGNLITTFGDHEESGSLAPDGTLAGLKTPAGSFAPSSAGFGIAVDQTTGDLYAIDARHGIVDVFDPEGGYLEQIGGEPAAYGCGGLLTTGIAVNDKSGELLLSTSCAANELPAVFRFELSTGTLTGSIDGSTTRSGSFGNLFISVAAADTSGYFYVSDGFHGVVDVFGSTGVFAGQISSTTTRSQEAVAVDQSGGDVYLAKRRPEETYVEIFGPTLVLPDVTTLPAEVHSTTEVTLKGEVNPAELPLTGCFFEYGPTTAYGHTAECEPDAAGLGEGNAPVPVEAQLTGLAPGAYHYRLVAANANGVNEEGNDEVFFTGASIDSTSVSEVAAGSATLEAELNPHGFPTTYHFEYDTTPYAEGGGPHGQATPIGSVGSGGTDVLRTAPIAGLTPNITYYFRATATNSLGTVFGPQRSFTTQGAFASLLPDDRAWELVSPPAKHGAALEAIAEEGGVIQAAADGSAITYFSLAPPDPEPAGSRSAGGVTQLLSTRAPVGGWSTADLATAHRAPAGYHPGNPSEYKLFSPDLSLGVVQPEGATPLSPESSEKTPYLRTIGGSYAALVNEANVPAGVHFGGIEGTPESFSGAPEFLTATPDMGHLLLGSPQPLTGDFAIGFKPTENVFEWTAGSLRLVSWLPPGAATECGPVGLACEPDELPGDPAQVGSESLQMRNAISADGTRIVFSTHSKHLYLRDIAREETIQLDAGEGCGSCGSGGGAFQYASADDSRVFFTDDRPLTEGSTAAEGKPDLYQCQIEEVAGHLACALTDITANHLNPGEPANVQGAVIGGADDGSSIYFAAAGAVTPDADPTSCIEQAAASCNLYRYEVAGEETSLVAALSGADAPDWATFGTGVNLTFLTARVSRNGRYLAFMSQRPLTGYDNRDAKTGVRDQEVYLYDAEASGGQGSLLCASCNPSGARPRGAFDAGKYPGLLVDRRPNWSGQTLAANLPGWTNVNIKHALYQSRYLSNSGHLFFNAADSLVPGDSNGTFDVYEFEFPQGPGQPASNSCTTSSPTYGPASGGCVSLISSGTSPEESAFMDASESGDDVFFLTTSRLTGKDTDSALDLYDARVGGGEVEAVKPVECSGDACQQPAVPPNDATPGSLTFNGAGNVLQCPKGKVRMHGKCVKKHKTKRHHKKSNKKKGKKRKNQRTNANRGGAK